MNKPSSKRPPSSRPPARRSLVELTAAASRAVAEGPPVAPLEPAATAIDRTPVAQTLEVKTVAGREVAEAPVVLPEAVSQKVAKELRDPAPEDFKVGMNAVSDHASDLVDTRKPSADRVARFEDPAAAGVGAAARYRAASLELVRASLETTIDHARGLIRARSLAECVKLSSQLARKQCQFAVRQAGALKSFARAAVQPEPS
jgi:hypothetical protein